MNIFVLKIIAIITMLIDHIGYFFFPDLLILRFIGRTAFPIYAFLIAQGFIYTKNKTKYFKRIIVMAFVSEIPFNLLFGKTPFNLQGQNVLFLFSIAIGTLILYEKLKEKNKDSYYAILIGIILAALLKVDYGLIGIVLIYIFYFMSLKTKDHILEKWIVIPAIFMIFAQIIENAMFYPYGFIKCIIDYAWIYFGTIIAFVILYFYNGKLGLKNKIINIIFYSFYPVHMFILYLTYLLI